MSNGLRGRQELLGAAVVLLCVWIAAATYVHSRHGGEPGGSHHRDRYWNGETARHVVNFMGRFTAQPLSRHWLAPSAPCEAPPTQPCLHFAGSDLPGSYAVTSARLNGEVVYISVPPAAMALATPIVLPLASATGTDPVVVLRLCNMALALVTALLWLLVLDRLLPRALAGRACLLVAGCLPLLASVEVLHSHYVSVWAHQLFQPIMAALTLMSLGTMTSRHVVALGLLAAFACWVEWTAYIACIAVQVVVLVRSSPGSRIRHGLLFAGIALCGGLTLLLYYALLFDVPASSGLLSGLQRYIGALEGRFVARSILDFHYDGADWLLSLAQSWFTWQLAAIVLLLAHLVIRRRTPSEPHGDAAWHAESQGRWFAAFLVCALPLCENLLMFEHAITYTFDRLKWGFLFGLLVAWFGQRFVQACGVRAAHAVLVIACLAGGGAVYQHWHLYVPYW